jgi:hypothetical protein
MKNCEKAAGSVKSKHFFLKTLRTKCPPATSAKLKRNFMKCFQLLLGIGLISLLVGCSSTQFVLTPVGPNPVGSENMTSNGELEVFSRLSEQCDNQNQDEGGSPVWYQHTDYRIYNLHGRLVKYVGNTIGHYDTVPRLVALPAGTYFVKAQAEDYTLVELPVTIRRGQITKVHLDGKWTFPVNTANTPKKELVSLPDGSPVGWCANSMGKNRD